MSQQGWDERWMATAVQKGSWSKDRSRKVGCVIVDADNVEVSNGWNGFPRRIDDDVEERHQRPAKYLWSEHAERNALYNAARKGRATTGCRIYQSLYPCAHCARGLVQSGITEVITVEPDWSDETYGEEWAVTREMLAEAGVAVRYMDGVSQPRKQAVAAFGVTPKVALLRRSNIVVDSAVFVSTLLLIAVLGLIGALLHWIFTPLALIVLLGLSPATNLLSRKLNRYVSDGRSQ